MARWNATSLRLLDALFTAIEHEVYGLMTK
jgi:hypothetical protein